MRDALRSHRTEYEKENWNIQWKWMRRGKDNP